MDLFQAQAAQRLLAFKGQNFNDSEHKIYGFYQLSSYFLTLVGNWPLEWIPRVFLIYLDTKISKIDADLTKLWAEGLGDDRVVPEAPPRPDDHVQAI